MYEPDNSDALEFQKLISEKAELGKNIFDIKR